MFVLVLFVFNPFRYFIKRYYSSELKPSELKRMLNLWIPFIFNRNKIIDISNIFKIDGLWEPELTDKTCKNMTLQYVSSQLECQSLCFESISCVGISYNNHGSDHCRLCKDYELTQAPSGFGFFKRPGKYQKR